MSACQIPFNKAELVGGELDYIQQAVLGGHISGNGGFSKMCEGLIEQTLGVPRVLLTTSCTAALEMTALLLEVQPGDEVILPSFTFVSTANAFALRGARLVFADIRPDTCNLDESRLEALITPRTKAIVVVHYAGVGCEMDAILEVARRHGIAVIEDNAHGLFGRYKGRHLGTLGELATLSFHETKNVTCGEGGALLVNDPRHIERAEILQEKGTDRSRFFRGKVDKYTWVDLGSSFVLCDVLAGFLYAQLQASERIQAERRRIWEFYYRHLEGWALEQGVGLPAVPAHCEQSYHMFYLLMPSLEQRQATIAHLKSRGIQSVFHYQPLHLSRMGRQFGGREGDCPVTKEIGDRLLRLPFYRGLTDADLVRVVSAITDPKGHADAVDRSTREEMWAGEATPRSHA